VVSRKTLAVLLTAAAALALAGCASPDSAESSSDSAKEFTIYASLGLSGPLASLAAANSAALNAAVDQVNAEGGIDGRQVRAVINDDGLDPAKATTLLQEQLDAGQIDLAFAGSTSNVGLALIAALTREGIISTGQQATLADAEKYPYQFGTVVPNRIQVQALVDDIAEAGFGSVGILHSNDANGQAVAQAYDDSLAKAGITVFNAEYAPTDVDMTAQLQALQADQPEALILQGLGPVAGYALKSRSKLGWDVPTFGHADVGGVDLSKITQPSDWNNVKVLTYYPVPEDTPRTAGYEQLMTALDAAGVTVDQPIAQYAVFWDAVFLAKKAWESAASTSPDDLKAAYLALDEKASPDSPYIFLPYYKYLDDTHQFDIAPADAMRVVTPAPLVDGVIPAAP
jgi:branched-chain amino acid transport system substrate-binding protein